VPSSLTAGFPHEAGPFSYFWAVPAPLTHRDARARRAIAQK
jgi:hypothetical protein